MEGKEEAMLGWYVIFIIRFFFFLGVLACGFVCGGKIIGFDLGFKIYFS